MGLFSCLSGISSVSQPLVAAERLHESFCDSVLFLRIVI